MSPRTRPAAEMPDDPTATDLAADQPEDGEPELPQEEPMSDTTAPVTSTPITSTPVPSTPSVPSTPQPEDQDRRVRVGTVVWGLVLAAIGSGLLAAALGVAFDVELAFIVLVAAAGVLLLVGSLASSRRRRR